MANRFYDPGAARSGKVNDLFATIASRYDLINDLQSFGLHRWWKRRLVRLARPVSGDRALDLCCGTGDIAARFARKNVKTVGLDFCGPMLEIARQKVSGGPAARTISFLRGDALSVPFLDDSFDIVSIGYGLRNLASWEAGLSEIWRVIKPGGRALILDFGKPANPAWRAVYFAYLRWFVPLFGRCLGGDSQAYAYILESLSHYPAQRGVEARMRELGFVRVQMFDVLGGGMSINYGEKDQRLKRSAAARPSLLTSNSR